MNDLEKFRTINTFIFDVDGVLTDSNVLVLENGRLLRKMSVRDGYALKRAVQKGFRVIIITGGKSEGVGARLKSLGIEDIHAGGTDKLEIYEELVDNYKLDEEQILYMGDDIPDLEVMRRVGMPVCPKDAVPEIRQIALYVSPFEGGQGCARDVIEKVLKLKNQWIDKPRLTAKPNH